MQKPFPITNAMREKVADQLTIQAIAEHGPRIATDLAALNEQFWNAHCANVEALPGLSRKHWAELIQAGAVTATASCYLVYMKPREIGEPSPTHFVAASHYYKKDERNTLVNKVLTSPPFEGVLRGLELLRNERGFAIRVLSPSGAVPRLRGMEVLTDSDLEALGHQICTDVEGVIAAAEAFRDQAMSLLMACRSSRQVEDLFPEAAKLLPQPVKNEKALAPTELAQNVRRMLSQGVPPVLAQA